MNKKTRSHKITARIFAVILLAGLCLIPAGTAFSLMPSGDTVEVSVIRVVDGDTIRVDFPHLGDTSVRLIGIDTPESRKNSRADLQAREGDIRVDDIIAMGKLSSKRMRSLVKKGDRVLLEFDAERTDRYGRVLAYVWKDGEMLNARMVEEGYAGLLTIPPNVKYSRVFTSLYREAREGNRGLWR